jgi:26S proteasome regulatory subunit N2
VVDVHWAEVCESLPLIEEISEDTTFPAADLAASIASKCFFHLQEYHESLRLAFSAGEYFDISESNEYIETLLSTCIDEYTELCNRTGEDEKIEIDPRMLSIIEQMYQRCYRHKCFDQAIGIALDTRKIDKVEEVCQIALNQGFDNVLSYTFALCQGAKHIKSRDFRLTVIAVLVKYYGTLPEPDYSNVCFGLQYLNRPQDVAAMLLKLCNGSLENALQAFQIAFDMQEAENQGFVLQVVAAFPGLSSSPTEQDRSPDGEKVAQFDERVSKLRRILVEGFDIDLTLNFLFKQSRTDISLLESIKTSTEGRAAPLHNATVLAHAYMNAGTTQDSFLRDNLNWLRKATNWAKFTAVASIGVVHKGHVHESMKLLQPYLPQNGISGSSFAESGALCALGLIHANKGGSGDSTTISYLTEALRNAGTDDVVQHGACLGIGLASMATGSETLYDELQKVLFTDNAVAGEGAALAIGLVLLGQSESRLAQHAIPDLLNYAHDTSHEKIIRALTLAIAMMVYGKEDSADVVIEQLGRDRDPIVRYGAMYATAMAYCGTADNGAVRNLLHVAVSDVNDDVRRAAVTCLGFVMFRSYETVPKLVSLLAESFNPHVRYGACMAVGISCAGTAFKDAIDLLQPMLEDSTDFVRGGAFMALAMVLMQASEARSPTVKKFHEHLKKIIGDKHQNTVTKSGAIFATGILEAGGRNVVVSLQSRAGFLKMGGVVGMVLWLQHWYWYPLLNMISLSFSPTLLIGLNKDFNVPQNFSMLCKAPQSMFAYPKQEEKKEDKKELVTTAVLSTTARVKAREARREAKKQGKIGSPGKMSQDDAPAATGPSLERVTSHMSTASALDTMSVEEKAEEGTKAPRKEASSFILSNPDRVIPMQAKFLSIQHDQRYIPVSARCSQNNGNSNPVAPTGIVILIDNDPTSPEEVSTIERVALGQEEEASPPANFEWDPSA